MLGPPCGAQQRGFDRFVACGRHGIRNGSARIAPNWEQELGGGGQRHLHASNGDGRTGKRRVRQRPAVMRYKLNRGPAIGRRYPGVSIGGEEAARPCGDSGSGGAVWRGRVGAGVQSAGRRRLAARRRRLPGNALRHVSVARVATDERIVASVDGVAPPLERPQQDRGLWLHTPQGGKRQHGTIEHARHLFHRVGELLVTGSADQFDRTSSDDEYRACIRGRAAAPSLALCGSSPGAATIGAADEITGTGLDESSWGEAGPTSGYMRQSPGSDGRHRRYSR